MAQRAKQFLRKRSDEFSIDRKDGGVVGSLVGLGYVARKGAHHYKITARGKDWIGRRKKNEG